MSSSDNRIKYAHKICNHRVDDKTAFKIAIDLSDVAGTSGYRYDLISRGYIDNITPNLPLVQLVFEFLKPNGTVLDLGAHVGTFCLSAAARGCTVYAVEASPRNVAALQESVRQNNWSQRLKVIHAAVSDCEGELEFSPVGPWGHITNVKTGGYGVASVKVPAVRVDDLLAAQGCNHLDFIKIDVEGAEPEALKGAEKLLRKDNAPPILYESNYVGLDFYNHMPSDLRSVLVAFGYAYHYIVRPNRLIAVSPEDFQGEGVGEYFATKTPLRSFNGWKVEEQLPQAELIQMILSECQTDDPGFRKCLAKGLCEQPELLEALLKQAGAKQGSDRSLAA